MNTTNYMNILGAKIKEAQRQLSPQAQRYINDKSNGDLFMGAMSYTYEIEQRYFMNDSDDSDYNLLLNIMHLIDMIIELDDDIMDLDDYYEDESEDVMIEIDDED